LTIAQSDLTGPGNELRPRLHQRHAPRGRGPRVEELVLPFDAKRGFLREPGAAFGPKLPAWTYVDPKTFYSPYISGAQRLPNGNTLICAGVPGRVFEVTAAGEIVWEFLNPHGGDHPAPTQAGQAPRTALFRARSRRTIPAPREVELEIARGQNVAETHMNTLFAHPGGRPVLSQSASAQQPGADLTAESGQAMRLPLVASAGDDGDGYDDLVAGIWEWDSYEDDERPRLSLPRRTRRPFRQYLLDRRWSPGW
jgi:hypothetical protein